MEPTGGGGGGKGTGEDETGLVPREGLIVMVLVVGVVVGVVPLM